MTFAIKPVVELFMVTKELKKCPNQDEIAIQIANQNTYRLGTTARFAKTGSHFRE